MTAPPAPQTAEEPVVDDVASAPRVRILLTVIEGADLGAALSVLGRQVYEPKPEIVVVGAGSEEIPDEVEAIETLEEAIAGTGVETDYLWILHSDARPRPDALAALVKEVERNEASLGGSKLLVAGSKDELESVGSATDVFGEPYSGLEEGEIDLQQYDVVREVAFVRSASMLVRRDLAQGLRGLDVFLPPVAAGLDFSQRTRLAGGRVISVPSSEVYHQGRCNEKGTGWREQAGRLRAMLTAYRPLTLLWVIPYDLMVSIVDALANLLLLRWRPAARHAISWVWNAYHLPSVFGLRRRVKSVRAAGDEELFRFQAKGSIRLRALGSELSSKALSLFDEDQALAERGRRFMASPGIWGAILGVSIALFVARSLIFTGIPNVGFSFPFETPTVSFQRLFGGWNDSGMGSSAVVHPSTAITAVASAIAFGAESLARGVLTVLLGAIGIAGMGRLGGSIGLRGPGRYLAGLVALAGPGTALLAGAGSWASLAAAAFLPWMVRAVMLAEDEAAPTSRVGWALLTGVVVGSLSPALVVVPMLFAIALGGSGWLRRLVVAGFGLLGALAALPFALGDPGWLLEQDRRLGISVADLWPLLVAVAALPMTWLDSRWRRPALIGAGLTVATAAAHLIGFGGPGIEEGLLITASLGAAVVAAVGLDVLSLEPRRLMGAIGALAILALSIGTLGNGRYGLPAGDLNERLGFAIALAEERGPGRVLVASTERSDVPGEARAGPGFWYRVVDGSGMTSDEAWLPAPNGGDAALEAALAQIAMGDELRPGSLLAPFAIDWLVLDGETFRLDEVLIAQLDLVPTPLDPESRVFENPVAQPLAVAEEGVPWDRDGTGFAGDPVEGRASISINHHPAWEPDPSTSDWALEVDASTGRARFTADPGDIALSLLGPAVALAGLALVLIGRARR